MNQLLIQINKILLKSGSLTVSECVHQEHLNYVTEISQEELYILDPESVLKETVGTSPGMPDLVDSEEQFAFPSSASSR